MPGTGAGGNGEFLFNRDRVSLWEDEKVLEVDDGDGCTAMRVCLMLLSCTLKMLKIVNFMYFAAINLKKKNNPLVTSHCPCSHVMDGYWVLAAQSQPLQMR